LKLAYFVRPHLGGTYSAYANLRAGLARQGVEVRWIGLGGPSASHEPEIREALSHGCFVSPDSTLSEKDEAAALIEMLREEAFDGVFINVLAERTQMNIARYLPKHILRIMIVHSITPATYAAARAIRDHVHATVAVSERARSDLIRQYGFPPGWTRSIGNAVDLETISGAARPRLPRTGLRLLFLGRLDDISKGVFWLADIMNRISPATTLTVAGDGPDAAPLRERLARFGARVTFLGPVVHERVPHLLSEHDVLIMPSRFEGSPLTLIEAMAAGCAPVVSRISGVTDVLVKHGSSGFLFPTGDWREAARLISELEASPALLAEVSAIARAQASNGYDVQTMSEAYFELIRDLQAAARAIAEPSPLEQWSIPAGFRPGLRSYLPQPVKNWLRVAMERL
jgi:glycosyltransferase involved in cell wall biosynthesis